MNTVSSNNGAASPTPYNWWESLPVVDLSKLGRPRVKSWLIEPLVPRGVRIAMLAESGAGKSWACLSLAAAVATGEPWLGLGGSLTPEHVVLVDGESSPEEVLRRAEMLVDPSHWSILQEHLHVVMLSTLVDRDGDVVPYYMQEVLRDARTSLLIVDTAASLLDISELDPSAVDKAVKATIGVVARNGGTGILVHHVRKGATPRDGKNASRGTGRLVDAVDLVWNMWRGSGADISIRVDETKNRIGRPTPPWQLDFTEDAGRMVPSLTSVSAGPRRVPDGDDARIDKQIVELLVGGAVKSRASIVAAIDARPRAVDARLGAGVKEGWLVKARQGQYALPTSGEAGVSVAA